MKYLYFGIYFRCSVILVLLLDLELTFKLYLYAVNGHPLTNLDIIMRSSIIIIIIIIKRPRVYIGTAPRVYDVQYCVVEMVNGVTIILILTHKQTLGKGFICILTIN